MNEWRFRTNWRGKLILQRRVHQTLYAEAYYVWRDATAGDLADYYNAKLAP